MGSGKSATSPLLMFVAPSQDVVADVLIFRTVYTMRLRLQYLIYSCNRAQIQDSQTILDLGYGQGPFTSHVALKHKNCCFTTVTDLISQKDFIKEQCK
ncbi:pavine N-methyltransferase-like [Magnolia sinica]|uniref:pavine N-methyltransferase-like n=1 Tax=Magnolia sinica TaxID=86752 RepID=UPI00265B2ADB|nr:pavine N-methyltransferase-like [Magnolia sinica]